MGQGRMDGSRADRPLPSVRSRRVRPGALRGAAPVPTREPAQDDGRAAKAGAGDGRALQEIQEGPAAPERRAHEADAGAWGQPVRHAPGLSTPDRPAADPYRSLLRLHRIRAEQQRDRALPVSAEPEREPQPPPAVQRSPDPDHCVPDLPAAGGDHDAGPVADAADAAVAQPDRSGGADAADAADDV